MVDNSHVTPPSSGSSPYSGLPNSMETGASKGYNIKGNSAIKNWARHFYPQMTEAQLNRFVQQFLQTMCKEISRAITKEMKKAKKASEKLKKAEKGLE